MEWNSAGISVSRSEVIGVFQEWKKRELDNPSTVDLENDDYADICADYFYELYEELFG